MTFLLRLTSKRPRRRKSPGTLPDLSPHMMRDVGLAPRLGTPRLPIYPLW